MQRELKVTERQKRLLQLLADGKSVEEAARELNIKKRTVEGHTYRLRLLFGSVTTAQLVVTALRRNIIK